ncbi:hypothetical protein AK812_SmicGene2014 [Symbiodinium microadriaticum]|uniref:Uncharacterized protein n=1 Tax=Symbiodinium microadriaticum TaxID=2951 RepID=A0A1Q9F2F8_SYMMI|nr:hypothetical protein AK812_SmicGene2014 [Symbiodinium microadriaticum]
MAPTRLYVGNLPKERPVYPAALIFNFNCNRVPEPNHPTAITLAQPNADMAPVPDPSGRMVGRQDFEGREGSAGL